MKNGFLSSWILNCKQNGGDDRKTLNIFKRIYETQETIQMRTGWKNCKSVSAQIQRVPLATVPGIEDIATKFEQEYVHCVRNEKECVVGPL